MQLNSLLKLKKPANRSKLLIDLYGMSPDPQHEFFDTIVCGIEVEVEKVGNKCDPIHGDVFHVKEDHSLRNNGREIITMPINSPLMVPAIRHIMTGLPPGHDFSLRTSIHFHFNVQDITMDQLLCILYTYILFEKCLYRFCHPSRKDSIFCVPVQETDLFLPATETDVINLARYWHKYSGLNLKPVLELGTIEFRHLEGTNDVKKISDWFYMLVALYQFGAKYNKTPNDLLKDMWKLNTTSEYIQFAHKVFGPWLECLDTRNIEQDMAEGVKALKQIKRDTSTKRDLLNSPSSKLYLKLFGARTKSKLSSVQDLIQMQLAHAQATTAQNITFAPPPPGVFPTTHPIPPQAVWDIDDTEVVNEIVQGGN